jgi:hypothetical protein
MRPFHIYLMDELEKQEITASYSNAIQSALELAGEELGLTEDKFTENTELSSQYTERLSKRKSNR